MEVVFPIEQPDLKQRLIDEILKITFEDNVKARRLLPDGSYERVVAKSGEAPIRSQQRFLELAEAAGRQAVGVHTESGTTQAPVRRQVKKAKPKR